MSFFADFHVHSRYSRATSKLCVLEWLEYWAQLKGLRVVGTGDFTHPQWLAHLRATLAQTASGLYRVNRAVAAPTSPVPASCAAEVLFIPTAEISSIYKRAGKVRK